MPSMTYFAPTRPLPVPPVHAVDLPLTPPTPANSSKDIATWAAHVQPGSPSKPRRRRPSISRLHLNLSSRNIQHGRARSGSSSFLTIIDTPSTGSHSMSPRNAIQTPTSSKSFEHSDLMSLGYTSVCLNLPPHTPEPAAAPKSSKLGRLTRIRSLSILRPRSKSVNSPAPPTSAIPPVPAIPAEFKKAARQDLEERAARKKAMYSNGKKGKSLSKSKTALPPTLANELALMQFMDGGSLESHAHRVMKARAKETAPTAHANAAAAAGLGAVHRDEKGGMWLDRDEEMEYIHLLAPRPTSPALTLSSSPLPTPSPPLSAPLSSPGLNGLDWVRFPCPSPGKENLTPLRCGSFADANASIVRVADDAYRYTPSPIRSRPRSRSRSRSGTTSRSASKSRANPDSGRRSRRRPAPLDLADARKDFVTSSFAPPVPVLSGSVSAALPGRFSRPALPTRAYSDPTDIDIHIRLPARRSLDDAPAPAKSVKKKASRIGFWRRG
ncbi:hypothetical protein HGRIS_005152 [Hohenbuehelia grisea]|uniref:Uncharacterized protein n=1 Tax=Hohenbuehelia grisea TaxID=104357 RepID=A0ABR3JEC9_9AGAR